MELFSEIYSSYYTVVAQILTKSHISEKEMTQLIQKNAFSESAMYLIPQLKSNWSLLSEKEGIYKSNLKKTPEIPLTLLQKRWIKSLLSDSRIRLFLDEDAITEIDSKLTDIKPLYNEKYFYFFDRFKDGDDFQNPDYIENFKKIHNAVINQKVLEFTFTTSKNKRKSKKYIPLRFEYSPKNNKFRIYAGLIKENRITDMGLINISRIQKIAETDITLSKITNTDQLLKRKRSRIPVSVEISSERNGVERFMMEFAGYEKQTEYDEKTRKCVADIWYNTQDETELLIRLLSFGPILEIKSPPSFRKLAKERIDRQYNISNANL